MKRRFLNFVILAVLVMAVSSPAVAEQGDDVEGAAEEQPDEEQPDEEQPAGGEIVAPELLYEESADYTDEAFDARIEGSVVLELEIDTAGDVVGVEVIEGLGYGLDDAAVAAAERFGFRPATVDGEPVSVVLDFTVNFSLPTLPAEFEGTVVDPDTDRGIAGAQVSIRYADGDRDPPPEATTATDDDGRFIFREVPPGTYDVVLRLDEYRDFETDIDLVGGETTGVEYRVRSEDDNVVGQIREAGTRSRLSAMQVTLLDAETQETVREDFSEAGGEFAFRGVPAGDYLLRVSGPDYVTASFEIEVVDGEMTTGNFYVRAEDYDGLTVRTTERRERSEVNRQTLGLDEVRRLPGAGSDVVRAVQNLPGVARRPLAGQPIIRGAAPEDTQIFLGGDNIPLAFHFLAGPAVINTEMIDSVDFYPGNFSSRFGRATAGVIDIQTRSPKDDRLHGMMEIDLLDASAIIEGPISERWSFAFSARRSYYDLFLPAIFEAADASAVVLPRYYDYQGWTTYRSEDGDHKVEIFGYGSDDVLEITLPDDQPQGTTTVSSAEAGFGNSFHRAQVRWEWTPEDSGLDTELMTSFGHNTLGFDVAENLFFDLQFLQSQTRYDLRYRVSDDLRLSAGVDTQIARGNVGYEFVQFDDSPDNFSDDGLNEPPPIPDEGVSGQQTEWLLYPAVYSEMEYEIFDRWMLRPGVRLDYYSDIDEISVSPRFTTRFGLTDEVALKGGIGLYTQPPIPGQADPNVGNPDLTYERAIHYALGTEWQPAEYLELDTTLFYRDNSDLIRTTSAQTIDDDGQRRPLIYDNSGDGRAYGWEILLRHYPRDKFFGWISYTLSRSERLDRDGQWVPYTADQTHILTLLAGYSLPWNLDISGRLRLVSGNPQTPIIGASYDADQDLYRPQRGAPNSIRGPTFNSLDLRLDRRFVFDRWTMSIYLDVTNAYNATNAEGTQYNYDYTESAPLRGLPILPTLGISARF